MSLIGMKPGRLLPPRLEIVIGGSAILLLGAALAADQAWFDRHFLPIFAVQRPVMMAAEWGVRGLVILTAMLLLIGRRPIARLLSRTTAGGILRTALAVALALGTVEL